MAWGGMISRLNTPQHTSGLQARQLHQGRRIWRPRAFAGAPTSSSASLVATRKALGLQLLQVLQEQDLSSSHGAVDACAALVAQAKAALVASSDGRQLEAAFRQAAAQYSAPAATGPQQRQRQNPWGMPTPSVRRSSSTPGNTNRSSSSAISSNGAGSSSSTGSTTRSSSARSRSSTSTDRAHSAVAGLHDREASAPQQAPAPEWQWGRVRHLVAFGTGSLGEYSRLLSSGARTEQECQRAGMRLFQLAMVLHMQEQLLPGLVGPPQLFDPEFDAFDRALMERLGTRVLPNDEGCRHTAHEPTLVYMPCCPRNLYDNVLDANWSTERLSRLAVLGTSFKSLAGSALLFQALTAGQQQGGQHQQQQRLAELSGKECVVEAFCPDCAAHGVATSLHLFPPGRTRAALPQ